MPWKVSNPTAAEIAPAWLRPYCEAFLQKLAEQGCAPGTMRIYDASARLLCQEVARRGLHEGELGGRPLSGVHAAALKAMHPNKYNQRRYCLERFVDFLVEVGIAERPKPPNKVPTALDRLAAEYKVYLREQRGLTEATIYHCIRFLHRFMAFRFGERLGSLNASRPTTS